MANNTCSEDMISTAYRQLFKDQGTLDFHTENLTQENDEQIDLFPVLELVDSITFFLESKQRDVFQDLIKQLDFKKCYLMRTGTVGGAGHFQLLRYLENQWEIYSTSTNNFKLTSSNGDLLEEAASRCQGSLNGTAIWGTSFGNSMILFAEMHQELIIKATHFIAEYRRLSGESDERSQLAIDYAMQHDSFNPNDPYFKVGLSQLFELNVNSASSEHLKFPEVFQISHQDLKQILDNYKTSFFIINMVIKILSFGFLSHQSGTILALRKILKDNKDFYTKDEICHAIKSLANCDSKKTSRASFFENVILNDNSGTFRVLSAIKNGFRTQ